MLPHVVDAMDSLRAHNPRQVRAGFRGCPTVDFAASRGWSASAWDRGRPARQAMEMQGLMSCLRCDAGETPAVPGVVRHN